jgi:hypothetical protein
MNVLVRGEETPKVFLAPRTVAVEIITAFEGMLEEKLNIFDPSPGAVRETDNRPRPALDSLLYIAPAKARALLRMDDRVG